MKKAILTTAMLLLCGLWAVAQQTYPNPSSQSSQSSSSSQATSTGSQTTVQGCLSGSNGSFTLTDKSGTAYQLTGDTSKLNEHVGHEVQITGTQSQQSTAAPSTAPGNPASAQPSIDVTSVKHIASSCSSSSSSKPMPPQ